MDHVTATETHIRDVLREKIPTLIPGRQQQPAKIGLYGGEFGTEDIIGTLDEMVQRGTHVLVSYMGSTESQHSNTGELQEGGANFGVYVAGRNLRSESEQKRDIYPVIQACRIIMRMSDDVVLTGDMGEASWQVKLKNLWPGEDSVVASVPGVACLQLEVSCEVATIWNLPDNFSDPTIS
jgi:hypothetical protein